jgi:hypothetical protein
VLKLKGDIMDYPVCDFTGPCGESDTFLCATSERGLQVNEQVKLNGNTDLHTCIRANDDGCVYSITLNGSPGSYDYVVNVDAQGPHGVSSGSMYLAFTDESGDTYHLGIYSSHRSVHTVRYDSEKPAIKKIFWSNKSIEEDVKDKTP